MAAKAKSAYNGKSRPVALKHLAATLADEHSLTRRQNQALLEDRIGLIAKLLSNGERIRVTGFGILQVRKHAARMGRRPATDEGIIKVSKKVVFRSPKELKLTI
jgi:DNA-binding protein HU-beta